MASGFLEYAIVAMRDGLLGKHLKARAKFSHGQLVGDQCVQVARMAL
jgi:hypothetical protein